MTCVEVSTYFATMNNSHAKLNRNENGIKKFDDSATTCSNSTLYVDWSDSKVHVDDIEGVADAAYNYDDSSRSLYVEWPAGGNSKSTADVALVGKKHPSAPWNRKSSMDTAVTTASTVTGRSASSRRIVHEEANRKKKESTLSRTTSSISLGLQQEKEHAEQQSTSSNRSLGVRGFLRRNASTGEIITTTNASRRGKRMSELTSNSNWDDDDDDDKSIHLEDINDSGDANGSSRSIFNKFIDRVKDASSSNLSAMTDFLAEEVGQNKYRSTYFKDRVSINVRRASDFLYSSHHEQGSDDGKSLGTSSSHREHTICTCNRTGNRLHHVDCGVRSRGEENK